MRENRYQSSVIERLRREFPGCLILKNDTDYLQGILDLTVLFGGKAVLLEVKASVNSPKRPNQQYYADYSNSIGNYAAFIYPENEEEVFSELHEAFATCHCR